VIARIPSGTDSNTVIDTTTSARTATLALGGEVGNTHYDPATHHLDINVHMYASSPSISARAACAFRCSTPTGQR